MSEKEIAKIKTVCVFASASDFIDKKYFEDASKLGCLLGKNGYDIVYGGSELGLMGAVTKSAKANGSNIVGVMPEKLYNLGINEGDCTDFILAKGMRDRKAKMDKMSDAVIALAGGFGTLEELCEMIVQKQIGYNNKPIIILNTDNYYNNLLRFYDEMIEKNFAASNSRLIYYVAQTPEDAINYLKNYQALNINYIEEKLKINR